MMLPISLPIQLLIVIASVIVFGGMLGITTVQALYTFSMVFKEVLAFILPAIVFFFVLSGIVSFRKNAPVVLSILLGTIFVSNAITALVSYGIVSGFFPILACKVGSPVVQLSSAKEVFPLFSFKLPQLIRSEFALLGALGIGIFCSFVHLPRIERVIEGGKHWIEWFVNIVVITLLPLYVLGFLLKIRYEGMLGQFVQHYSGTFLLIISVQMLYLFWVYFVAARFSFAQAIEYIKNAFSSYITAFSTMSSTATIPVSISAAQKNTGNGPLAKLSMPIMANVHLLGDSICTPILAMGTMVLFFGCIPDLWSYASFVFYFCTTMFAVSGIPGGGILVMIPILISHFNFTPEMVSIITALYLLLDPFGTAANVMGDGALVIIVNKFLGRIGIKN